MQIFCEMDCPFRTPGGFCSENTIVINKEGVCGNLVYKSGGFKGW